MYYKALKNAQRNLVSSFSRGLSVLVRECCSSRKACVLGALIGIVVVLAAWLYFVFFSGCLLMC